ncbi:MAG: hypothetical protein SNJ71_06690, partial [Bacteroidales bacterium]
NKNAMTIHFNNLIQDYNTLLLLLSNCKYNCVNPKLSESITATTNKTNEVLQEIKHIKKLLNQFCNKEKQVKVSIFIKEKYYTQLKESLEYLQNFIDNINNLNIEKKQELIERKNLLKDSFSQIITNLQYEDIIRQKLDHIITIQNKILEEIQHNNTNETVVKYQVRQITELQIAQLVHTNKEFKEAIKIITDKFEDLSHNLNKALDYNEMFLKDTDTTCFTTIAKKIDTLNQICNNFLSLIQNVIIIDKQFPVLTNNFQHYQKSVDTLIQILKQSPNSLSSVQIELLSTLLQEINRTILSLTELMNLNSNTTADSTLFDIPQLLENTIQLQREIVDSVKNQDTAIIPRLAQNRSTITQTLQTINDTMEKVRYYNTFEDIIQEVITDMEQIYTVVSLSTEEEISQTDFSKLKSLYTMKSEHEIHELILEKSNSLSINTIKKESNDNLELF